MNSPRILEIEKSLSAERVEQTTFGKTCFLYKEKLKLPAIADELRELLYSFGLQLKLSMLCHGGVVFMPCPGLRISLSSHSV